MLAGVNTVRRGIIWFDAHGDFNTPETTVTGFLGGMPMAAAVGRCWSALCVAIPGFVPVPEADVVLIDARALDPLEREHLYRSQVRVIPETAVRGEGGLALLRGALEMLAARVESVLP